MANGNLDVLGLLFGQAQQQQQQSLDPASFIQSLTQPSAAPTMEAPPVVPTRAQFEPEPLSGKQLAVGGIAEVLANFLRAKAGQPPLERTALQEFARERRARAEREFQDALREFELSEQRRREGREEARLERTEAKEDAYKAALLDLKERDFAEGARQFDLGLITKDRMAELDRRSRENIARLQANRETSAVGKLKQQRLDEVDALIRQGAINIRESLEKGETPEQIRREFDIILSTAGLTDEEREQKELLFLKFIEPVLREHQAQATAQPPSAGLQGLAQLAPQQVGAEAGASLADLLRGVGVGPVANVGFGALPFLQNR